ncbi:MAG: polymerase, partial [Actinomycetota bacterium]
MPKPLSDVKRLLLIDGHSLAYRAFYALPVESFAAPDGTPTNALHGFLLMLTQVVEQEKPTHIAVAFDHSRQTFRSERFEHYKAQRAASPEEFKVQVPILKELLETCGVQTFTAEGFEADDVIATLAHRAVAEGFQVDILTSDRDCFQLVSRDITVLFPLKGVKDLGRFTPEKVLEKYGVTPEQYPHYAALRGDTSDNLPSVPGVGEKTAAAWISQFDTIENLFLHQSELKGKVAQSLAEHESQVHLNLELNVLRVDVPIDVIISTLLVGQGDSLKIQHMMDKLGFKQTRAKLLTHFAQQVVKVIEPTANHALHDLQPLSVNMVREYAKAERVYGWFLISNDDIATVALSDGSSILWFSTGDSPKDSKLIMDEIANLQNLVVYDAKSLLKVYLRKGKQLSLKVDLQLIAYLENPGTRLLEFSDAVRTYLNRDLNLEHDDGLFPDYEKLARAYLNSLIDLDLHLLKLVSETDAEILTSIDLPILQILAVIEDRGIQVDISKLKDLEHTFESQMEQAARQAEAEAGQSFNIASPKQLQEVLFDVRKLPKTKKIKTGYTTDAEALNQLFTETKDKVVEQILRWREVSKLKQVASSLLPLIDNQGRI